MHEIAMLTESIEDLDEIEAQLEVCHALRGISDGGLGNLLREIALVRRQLGGLLKTYEKFTATDC